MEKEEVFRKLFKFTDADNCVVEIDVKVDKVTNDTNKKSYVDLSPMPNYLMLSIRGKNGYGSGQIYRQINPKGGPQSLFLNFWKQNQLNELQAGTINQMNYLESTYEQDWKAMYNTVKDFVNKNNIEVSGLKYLDDSDKTIELQRKLQDELNGIGIDSCKFFLEIFNVHSKFLSKVEYDFKSQLEYLLNSYNITDLYMKYAFMSSKGLLYDKNCNNYKYGEEWLVKEFNFDALKQLIDAIIDEENKCKGEKRQELIERYNNNDDDEEDEDESDEDEEDEEELPDVNEDSQELLDLVMSECNCDRWDAIRVIALLRSEDIDLDELWNIDIDSTSVISYGSTEYYVDTYSNLRQIAIDYLTDERDLWVEAVKSGSTDDGLKDWVEDVVDIDGIGNTLNHWDGTEDYENVFDEQVYVVRQ